MTERLHRDVFPAEVFVPRTGQRLTGVRAFVTNARVLVWEGTGTVALDETLEGPAPERNRGTQGPELELATAAGPVFVARDTGCGCGSPLKRLDPAVPW